MKRQLSRARVPFHHGVITAAPAPPPSTALYLHATGNKLFDTSNTEVRLRGAQWTGLTKSVPYTERVPGPTGHGDIYVAANTYNMNLVRINVPWDSIELNAPTRIPDYIAMPTVAYNSGDLIQQNGQAYTRRSSAVVTATRIRYVSPTATFTGGGAAYTAAVSEATACHIRDAKNNAVAGDAIIVLPGTINLGAEASIQTISFDHGGSAGSYVTWIAKNPLGTKFTYTGASFISDFIQFTSTHSSYVKFIGFEIDGNNLAGNGIHANGTFDHFEVSGCFVHNCINAGIALEDADYFNIVDNIVWNCGQSATTNNPSGISVRYTGTPTLVDAYDGFHNYICGNIVAGSTSGNSLSQYKTDGNGIILDNNGGASATKTMGNTLIFNNLCFHNGNRGVHVFGMKGQSGRGILVLNNTSYMNGLDSTMTAPAAGLGSEIDIGNGASGTAEAWYENNIAVGFSAVSGTYGTTPFRDISTGAPADLPHASAANWKFGGLASQPMTGPTALSADPFPAAPQPPAFTSVGTYQGQLSAPDPRTVASKLSLNSTHSIYRSGVDPKALSSLTANQVTDVTTQLTKYGIDGKTPGFSYKAVPTPRSEWFATSTAFTGIKHDWNNADGTINAAWDTPGGLLQVLDNAINDARGQVNSAGEPIRFILEFQQTNWSAAFGGSNVGFPTWVYPTSDWVDVAANELKAAKWEFFQPNGGYQRPSMIATPQALLLEFWNFICNRYKNNDLVVGIDSFNEPGWPTTHPFPSLGSGVYIGTQTPTDVQLVAWYNSAFTAHRAIQPLWLLIYENGTYANTDAGRSPLTAGSTPPSGTNCVMSWHYYPANDHVGTGNPLGNDSTHTYTGSAPSLAKLQTALGYLEAQRALAMTTFNHPFWVGETSLFEHVQNNIKNADFDYADSVGFNTWLTSTYSTSFPAGLLIWDYGNRHLLSDAVTKHYHWAIWAFQSGAGRSMLNSDGTPKTADDLLRSLGLKADSTVVANTVAPVLSGAFFTGNTVTTNNGTWSGSTPITYAYQWKRDGSNITSATANTYLLTAADEGHTITCTVTATNVAGSASATGTGTASAALGAYGPQAGLTARAAAEVGGTFTAAYILANPLVNRHFTTLVTITGTSLSHIAAQIVNCQFDAGLTCTYVDFGNSLNNVVNALVPFNTAGCTGNFDYSLVQNAVSGGITSNTTDAVNMSNVSIRPGGGHTATVGFSVTSASGKNLKAIDIQSFTTAAVQLNGSVYTDVQNVVFDSDGSGNKTIIGGTFKLQKSYLSGIKNATFKGAAPSAFDIGGTDPSTATCVSPVCLYNTAETLKTVSFGGVNRTMRHVVDLGHDLSNYWTPVTQHLAAPMTLATVAGGVQVTSGQINYDVDGVTPLATALSHGFLTSDVVTVRNMGTWIGGGTDFTVTKIDANNFKLNGATLLTSMPALAMSVAPWPDIILKTPDPGTISQRQYVNPGRHPIGTVPADDGTADPPVTGLPATITCTISNNGKISYTNSSATPYVFEGKAFTHDSYIRIFNAAGKTPTAQQKQDLKLNLTGPFIFRRCLRKDVILVADGASTNVTQQDCWLMATCVNTGAVTMFSDDVSNWWTKYPTTPYYDGKVLASDKFDQVTGGATAWYDRCLGLYHNNDVFQLAGTHLFTNTTWIGADALGTPANGPHADQLSFSGSLVGFDFHNCEFHAGGHTNVWGTGAPVSPASITFRDSLFDNVHHDSPGVTYTATTRGFGPNTLGMNGQGSGMTSTWIFDNMIISSQPQVHSTFLVQVGKLTTTNSYWSGTGGGHTDGDAIIVSGTTLG